MRKTILFSMALVVPLFLLLLYGCPASGYVPNVNEEIYGTWVNEKSVNAFQIQKVVNTPEGTKEYTNVSGSVPAIEATRRIHRKWKDREGNVWYEAYGTITKGGGHTGFNYKTLSKLSSSASVLEVKALIFEGDFSSAKYPKRIIQGTSIEGYYYIFYRSID